MQTSPAPMTSPASTIERVETLLLDLPTIRPHRLSMATMDGQTVMLVRIQCSDGVVGVGEGTNIGGLAYGGESPEALKLAVHTYFAPRLRGGHATRAPALQARLDRSEDRPAGQGCVGKGRFRGLPYHT